MLSAEELKQMLDLAPLPIEGGIFKRIYVSSLVIPQAVLPARYEADKLAASHIFNLHLPDSQQFLHRLITDEIHHFYLGDPITFVMFDDDGRHEVRTLGSDLAVGHEPVIIAPAGVWQGSFLQAGGPHGYGLKGATMAPAFDFSDFDLADRKDMLARFPQAEEIILRLTPEDREALLEAHPQQAAMIIHSDGGRGSD
jgi:hypothetical protein